MILPVSSLQTKGVIKQNSAQKNKIDYLSQGDSPTQEVVKSHSKIAFKGKFYDGIEYSDEEIATAKKYMHRNSTKWKEELYNLERQRIKAVSREPGMIAGRLVLGILTAGVSELAIHEATKTSDTKEMVNRVATLVQHLEREEQFKVNEARQAELATTRRRIAREAEEAEERNRLALAKTEYLNKLSEKQNELKTELCDKVNLERNGSHIEKMPNTIMIEDSYDDVSKELVDYARRNSQSRFIRLDSSNNDTLMDNLDETLKKSKAHFDSTKERTLIHVEGFDRLITKGKNSFENIDSLKDIMCRTASDFGSTIIFRTKDAKKLVSEAIQPQRVIQVLVKFKSVR